MISPPQQVPPSPHFTFAHKPELEAPPFPNEPKDYGVKKYTELDIAAHSIMFSQLPKDKNRRKIEQQIKAVLKQLFTGYKTQDGKVITNGSSVIMQVSVISDYGSCLKMVNKLKLAAGRYKKCLH